MSTASWRDHEILIIDDNESRRRNVLVILDFLGEKAASLPSHCWVSHKQQVSSVAADRCDARILVVGELDSTLSLQTLLLDVQGTGSALPVILLGDVPGADDIDPLLKALVISHLSFPFDHNKLLNDLQRARAFYEQDVWRKRSKTARDIQLFRSLVGTSRALQSVKTLMAQVVDNEVTVLITGESGTGKEVVARNLHYHSQRRGMPFVPVNCGAIPAELLESELFGHEKGAFTGAIAARAGRFEMAKGGTLFLDEIGDMPVNMQAKILRVLQERTFERVGSNKTEQADVRIIAATHKNLEAMIEGGTFREDLFYRLNIFPIEMPSLRERAEDIPLLINELVARLQHEKRGTVRFDSASIVSLCQHSWGGNVRELANLVERMAILHPYGVVGVNDLPAQFRHIEVDENNSEQLETNTKTDLQVAASANAPDKRFDLIGLQQLLVLPREGIDLKNYMATLELNLIQQALDDSLGVVAHAAERLKMRRTTLVEKMRKYDMQRSHARKMDPGIPYR